MNKLLYPVILSVVLLGACGGGADLLEPPTSGADGSASASLDSKAAKTCTGGGAKKCTGPQPAPSTEPAPTPTAPLSPAPYPVGSSSTSETLDSVPFDVFTYKPAGTIKGILLVFHGTNRNAADYRTWARPLADKAGLVVAAPLFDSERFTSTQYHRGNVLPGSSPGTWSTRFTPLLISAVQAREGNLPVYVFGFSAGGQYVARVAAFETLPQVVRIVSGGASTYVLPKLGSHPNGEAAPYGMGMIYNPGEAELTRYLVKPYSLIVGSEDTSTDDPNLAVSDAAMRQGTQRLDRAQKTFHLAQTVAPDRGVSLTWDLYVVPGVGHSASAILRSAELQKAMRLPSPAPL